MYRLYVVDSLDSLDYLSVMDRPPLTPEQRAAMKRIWDRFAAWSHEHPDCVPRIPHYRHTCLSPDTCTRDHDPI